MTLACVGNVQAAFFRQVIAARCSKTQQYSHSSTASKAHQQGQSIAASTAQQHGHFNAASTAQLQEGCCSKADLESMLAESLQYAKADVKRFVQETQRAGWNVHPIMLSSYERSTFSPV